MSERDLDRPECEPALRTVRRQFHTLKGSGRMVGLTELGEHAYKVEAIHNRLLEEEHAVTPTVIAMIGVAEAAFRGWIATLKESGHVRADPAKLVAAIAAVEAELPAEGEPVSYERVAPAAAVPADIEIRSPEETPDETPELPERLVSFGRLHSTEPHVPVRRCQSPIFLRYFPDDVHGITQLLSCS